MGQAPIFSTTENKKEILILATLCLLLQAILIVSDVLTFKVARVGSIIFTLPALLYPLTYAIGDSLTEAYGRKTTLMILTIAIFFEVIFDLLISYAALVPPVYDVKYYYSFNYSLSKMYIAALGVVAGSIVGFLTNTTIMHFLKTKFSYRSFPVRSILSSLTGEIVFTITAFSIWFYSDPTITYQNIIKLIASSASLKVIFAILYSFPAYWVAKYLVKSKNLSSESLRILDIAEIGDKPGHSMFNFQIAGKRVCFSSKANKVTLNMFFALNKDDQKIIEADLKGKITSYVENWARKKYATENSINSRGNEWNWTWDSKGALAKWN